MVTSSLKKVASAVTGWGCWVLTQAWAIRSERESLPAQSVLSKSMLLYAVLLTFCLQLALLYVPWLNPIFKTEPHSAWMS